MITFTETEGAFGVYLGRSQTGVSSPLHPDGFLANRGYRFNISTNNFRSRILNTSQFVYIEICAGVLGSKTSQLQTTGAYPQLSFDWMSTAQNGVDSGCRGGVTLSVSNVIEISIGQNGGGVYSSNDQKETTWSMFSVTDTMKYASQLLFVTGSRSSCDYGALPSLSRLVEPVAPYSLYDAATTAYTCTSDASAYFFSLSVGVPAGSTATVKLVINEIGYTFKMTRQNTRTTGTTTLARTVLVPCTSEARMILIDGVVEPGTNLISLTAFPYALKTGPSVSWAGYRTRDVTVPGTITYDLWLVQEGINFQVKNSIVLIPINGYYYVYASAGVGQGKQLVLTVLLNNNSLFGVTRTATDHNGVDTIGHGMVVLLSVNDQLKVDIRTTAYSSSTGLHTSFIGMLLDRKS